MALKMAAISANTTGDKLFIKDYRIEKGKHFIKYRTTYNDIPFIETEIYLADTDKNFIITGTDGTVIWRFSVDWIKIIS